MKKTRNQRQFALLTGISLVAMTIIAGTLMGIIYAPIFAMDTPAFTKEFANLKAPLFIGAIGWMMILLCDIAVSWGLYKFYQNKNSSKSMMTGVLRMLYSLILLIAIIQLIRASIPSNEASESYNRIQLFQSIWQFGLIIFGVHLLFLAPLVYEKRNIKTLISGALFLAGFGYILSNILDFFIADYEQMRAKIEAAFILPMIFGELGLAVWLLIKGGKAASSVKK